MANFYLSSFAYGQIPPWGGQQNRLLQSNAFTTTWTTTNSVPTQSGTDADPFGGTTAWRLTDNVTNGVHQIQQSITKAAASQRHMGSIYAKAGPTLTRIRLQGTDVTGATNGIVATFDLTSGQIGAAVVSLGAGFTVGIYKIEPVQNQAGWFRCQLSVVTNTATTLVWSVMTDNGTGTGAASSSYAGSGNYVLICGAQDEPSLYVCGKYTATTTAAVGQTVSFTATVGMIRRPTDPGADGFATTPTIGLNSERAYRCTTGGTSGSVEPSAANGNPWPSQTSGTVTDNLAVWTEITGQEAFQVAGTWAPYARLFALGSVSNQTAFSASILAGGTGYAVGDIVLVTGVLTAFDYPVFKVSTVSAGVVTAVTRLDGGVFGSPGTTTTKVTGAGSGLTLTLSAGNQNPEVAGDNIYVGNRHNEWNNAAVSVTLPGTAASPNLITSVDESASGAVPPTASNLLAGAKIATVANNLTIAGSIEGYGCTFQAGSVGQSVTMQLGASTVPQKYSGCQFIAGGTNGGAILTGGSNSYVSWDNCTVKFSTTGNSINIAGWFIWRNTASAIQGSVIPSTLLTPQGFAPGVVMLEGVDLSALAGNKLLASTSLSLPVQAVRSKIASNTVIFTAASVIPTSIIDLIQCDSGSLVTRNERYWTQGTLTTDTAVTRTGGSVDDTTAISWKVATTANNNRAWPFETWKMSIENATVGSAVSVNVYGVTNQPTPNTGDLWLDVDYLGTLGSTLGSIATQQPANALTATAALTADTSAWDANVTARANTTAYVAGNVIKSANNVGRIFICTAPGTSAGSEPGGYATAVDGGSVTDGGATFVAGYRFKQTLTITPRIAGYIHATIKVAKASTTAIYWIDNQPTVT